MSKSDLKFVALTVASIMAAGYIMNALRDNQIIAESIAGYDA